MLNNAFIERVPVSGNTDFGDIFREGIEFKRNDNTLPIYTLGPLGSYSSRVAYELGQNIIGVSKHTSAPEIRFTSTNKKTIEVLSGGNLGVVPMYNELGGIVAGNMKAIDELVKIGHNIQILGWVALKVNHVLASRGTSMKDIRSVHSHPQALSQCRESLRDLGCMYPSGVPDIEKHIHTMSPKEIQRSAFIIAAQETGTWKEKGYSVLQTGFQDSENATQRYTLIGKSGDRNNISHIIGSYEAIKACAERVQGFGKVKTVEENSTTAHITKLSSGEAVICSEISAQNAELNILDKHFSAPGNTTHFAVLQRGKTSRIPDLRLNTDKRICTYEIHSPDVKNAVDSFMERIGIKVLFHKIEPFKEKSSLFTGIIQLHDTRNLITLQREVDKKSGNIHIL